MSLILNLSNPRVETFVLNSLINIKRSMDGGGGRRGKDFIYIEVMIIP